MEGGKRERGGRGIGGRDMEGGKGVREGREEGGVGERRKGWRERDKARVPQATESASRVASVGLNLNLNDYVEVPRSLVLYDVGGFALIIKILQF